MPFLSSSTKVEVERRVEYGVGDVFLPACSVCKPNFTVNISTFGLRENGPFGHVSPFGAQTYMSSPIRLLLRDFHRQSSSPL